MPQREAGDARGRSDGPTPGRTRARILDAASAALRESEDASMHAIAKRAGIGWGTLYRNFSNREALILAVYRSGIQDLGFLWCVEPDDEGRARADRLLDIVIKALRSEPAAERR